MREIKFRAYSNIRGMVEVKGIEFIKKKISTPSDDGRFWVDDFCDMELMQYTGLKDRNGKEIYESDIISIGENMNFVVIYDSEFGSFHLDGSGEHMYGANLVEVIGNIYENPELLDANPKE